MRAKWVIAAYGAAIVAGGCGGGNAPKAATSSGVDAARAAIRAYLRAEADGPAQSVWPCSPTPCSAR
jgi:hypothetical protein